MHDTTQSLIRVKARKGLWVAMKYFFLIFAFAVLVLSFIRPDFLKTMRSALTDALTPIINFTHDFFAGTSDHFYALTHFSALSSENEKLKDQQKSFLLWKQLALKLEAENTSLKELLHFSPENKAEFVTAPVLMRNNRDGNHLLIKLEAGHKIQKGNLVLGKNGVIGKISEVATHHARVLLMNDTNSRLPVRIEGKDISAIAAGELDGRLRLTYVPQGAFVASNDRLVTSSDGQIIPQGYFVGTIGAIEGDKIEVIPASPLVAIDFVIIIVQAVENLDNLSR